MQKYTVVYIVVLFQLVQYNMLWKINNFLERHFPSMKVILKNDWGNHFCIDSESEREGKNNLWFNA